MRVGDGTFRSSGCSPSLRVICWSLPIAEDGHVDVGIRGGGGDRVTQCQHVFNRLAIEGLDDVAGLKFAMGGGVGEGLFNEDADVALIAKAVGFLGMLRATSAMLTPSQPRMTLPWAFRAE